LATGADCDGATSEHASADLLPAAVADGVEITHGRPSYEDAGASIQPPARAIRNMPPRADRYCGANATSLSRRSSQPPSGSSVRVMKDRLATVYAKVLFFSTWPFKNEFEPWVPGIIRALRYLRFAGVA